MANRFKPGTVVRHFKGKFYKVLTHATQTETGEELVIYQALYGDKKIFARPTEMFYGLVDKDKYPDATQSLRFEPISEETEDHFVSMIAFKQDYGSFSLDQVALFDRRDLSEEEALDLIRSEMPADRIVVMSEKQYETIFRSLKNKEEHKMAQNWPIKEVAFVITPEVLAMMNFLRMKRSMALPEKYNMPEQKFMRKLFGNEIDPFEDDLDCVDFLCQALPDIQIHAEFTGTAKTLDDVSDSPVELNYEDDFILYLPLNCEAQYCSAAYHSPEEMSEEIRERIGNLLPGWWDISMTLCEITGTYFC